MTSTSSISARGTSWLLVLLLAAPFMAQLDATIANVATPSIHADLHASGAMLQLVIGAYLTAFGMLLITGARLGHSWGYRRLYIAGMTVFGAASLLCGVAPSPIVLVIARACQGAGAALMFPQSLTGIQLNFTGDARLRAIGLYAIALSTGAVIGQILGGVLVSANIAGAHWRPIFLLNLPVTLIVIAGALTRLPVDQRETRRRIDALGVSTLSLSLLLLVLPLVLGQPDGWPAWSFVAMGASIPSFALFVRIESRQVLTRGSPLINVGILARPQVFWALVAIMLTAGGYYAILFCLAQYMQGGLGHSALISGLTLVPWVAAFGLAGRLLRTVPAQLAAMVPAAGCVLLAIAYGAMSATVFTGHHPELLLLALLGVGGFGLGLVFSALIGHLTNAVPADYAPDISGVSTTTVEIGGVLGVAAFGTLYLGQLHGTAAHATHAFAIVTLVLAILSLIAVAATRPAMKQSASGTIKTEMSTA